MYQVLVRVYPSLFNRSSSLDGLLLNGPAGKFYQCLQQMASGRWCILRRGYPIRIQQGREGDPCIHIACVDVGICFFFFCSIQQMYCRRQKSYKFTNRHIIGYNIIHIPKIGCITSVQKSLTFSHYIKREHSHFRYPVQYTVH